MRTQSRSYLTGTIKSCTKSSKSLHYSFAVITFDSIEGGYSRKGFMPPHVLLYNIPEVSNIEGIFIILEQIHILKLQPKDNRISLEISIWGEHHEMRSFSYHTYRRWHFIYFLVKDILGSKAFLKEGEFKFFIAEVSHDFWVFGFTQKDLGTNCWYRKKNNTKITH